LARRIQNLQIKPLTIVTNAVNIAMELAGVPDLTLILIGGSILADFFVAVGPLAEQSLNEMYVDKALISVTALNIDHGLTTPNQLGALTYRAMMRRARQTIVLVDHTKLGAIALHRIAPITAIHTVITDAAAEAGAIEGLRSAGIEVLTV
jgi:DeoR/GlpR family transcriptional regulator of sugar metabolism